MIIQWVSFHLACQVNCKVETQSDSSSFTQLLHSSVSHGVSSGPERAATEPEGVVTLSV